MYATFGLILQCHALRVGLLTPYYYSCDKSGGYRILFRIVGCICINFYPDCDTEHLSEAMKSGHSLYVCSYIKCVTEFGGKSHHFPERRKIIANYHLTKQDYNVT